MSFATGVASREGGVGGPRGRGGGREWATTGLEAGGGRAEAGGGTRGGGGREEHVEWVRVINAALAHSPVALVVVLLVLDWSAACLFAHAYRVLGLSLDADFAFAFALNKGVVRYPRYALDAALAAWAVAAWPELGRVKVDRLWTAGEALRRAASRARRRMFPRPRQQQQQQQQQPPPPGPAGGGRGPREVRAARTARRLQAAAAGKNLKSLWKRFGFAFILVKSVTGPATVLATWALLRAGVDVPGALAAVGMPALTSLGRDAGLVAAGFTTSAVMGFPMAIASAVIVKTLARLAADVRRERKVK